MTTFGAHSPFEARDISIAGGSNESVEQPPLLGPARGHRSARRDVLSREGDRAEVRWSLSAPIPWPVVARGFGLPVDGPGAPRASSGGGDGNSPTTIVVIVAALILLACVASFFDDDDGSSAGGTFIGGGVFSGGK